MEIPRSYVEAYSRSLNLVSKKGVAALADALSRIDYRRDVASVRGDVVAVMQRCCGASSVLAAAMASEFYDGLRERFGVDDGFKAVADPCRDPAATEGAVRAFVQDLVDGKPKERFQAKCLDRLDYETRLAANRCVERNARRDPRRPRYARVPTGAETCRLCIMLASRGFVYRSAELASHSHANCDCRVVPSWDKDTPAVEGYDPDYYIRIWTRLSNAEVIHRDFYSLTPSEVRTECEVINRAISKAWNNYKSLGEGSEDYQKP